jgi:hypothetical protein
VPVSAGVMEIEASCAGVRETEQPVGLGSMMARVPSETL